MKKNRILYIILFICLSFISLSAYTSLDIKLRIFEGIRKGIDEQPYFNPNSYLKPIFTAIFNTGCDFNEEERKIRKIFNLKDVYLIDESSHKWRFHGWNNISHVLHLENREYFISIIPVQQARNHQFKIVVSAERNLKKEILLDTKIILTRKSTVLIGFEDINGKPYFISFHITGGTMGGIVGRVIGCLEKKKVHY